MNLSNNLLCVAIAVFTIVTLQGALGQETTTTAPSALPVVNFTWPKNDSQPACLMVKLSLEMTIGYPLEDKSNGSQKFILQQSDDYTGDCDAKFNQLEVTMTNGWKLVFNYTLDSTDDAKYKLSRLALDYTVTKALFPNVSSDYVGPKTAELANLTEFSTKTGNSYKCNAQTTIMLDSKVTFEISNYQGEPFIPKDKKDKNFDTAVDCPADTTATSKLVPIIVGSTLAVLVVLVLVAYIIGRRKHRPGYQQV